MLPSWQKNKQQTKSGIEKKLITNMQGEPQIDKIYKTKFQTGEEVLVKALHWNHKGELVKASVIFQNSPHLGICPLNIDRIILGGETSQPLSGIKFIEKKLDDIFMDLAILEDEVHGEMGKRVGSIKNQVDELGKWISEKNKFF